MCYITPSSVLYKQDNERLYKMKMNKDRVLVNEETENLKDKMLPETEIKEKMSKKLQELRELMLWKATFTQRIDLFEALELDGVDWSGSYKEIGKNIIKSSILIEGAIERGINLAAWRDEKGRNLMHYVFLCSDHSALSSLVKAGVDINAQDKDGNTPLHIAAMNHHKYTILTLYRFLEYGPALNIRNNRGLTPSEEAIMFRMEDVYIMLIKARDHGKNLSRFQVCEAVRRNDADFITDVFIRPNTREEFGRKNDLEGRRVKYDFDFNPNEILDYLLFHAVRAKSTDVLSVLLQKADPCVINEIGNSLFFTAILGGDINTIKVLLDDERTDINYHSAVSPSDGVNDISPLNYAVFSGKTDVVKLLLNDKRIQVFDKEKLLDSADNPAIIELLKNVEETPKDKRINKEHKKIISSEYGTDFDITGTEMETSMPQSQKIAHHDSINHGYCNSIDRYKD